MKIRVLLAFLLVPLVAGCAPKLDEATVQAARDNLKPNVAAFGDMNFSPISYPATVPTEVTGTDPIFDFGNGNISYFKAFELPDPGGAYALRVDSAQFVVGCYPCRHAYFVPSIMLLDENRNPLPATIHGPVYWGGRVTRHVWVDIAPDMKARYAIVYTTQEALAHGTTMKGSGGVMPAGGIFIYVPAPTHRFQGSPIGPVTIVTTATGDPR